MLYTEYTDEFPRSSVIDFKTLKAWNLKVPKVDIRQNELFIFMISNHNPDVHLQNVSHATTT